MVDSNKHFMIILSYVSQIELFTYPFTMLSIADYLLCSSHFSLSRFDFYLNLYIFKRHFISFSKWEKQYYFHKVKVTSKISARKTKQCYYLLAQSFCSTKALHLGLFLLKSCYNFQVKTFFIDLIRRITE